MQTEPLAIRPTISTDTLARLLNGYANDLEAGHRVMIINRLRNLSRDLADGHVNIR